MNQSVFGLVVAAFCASFAAVAPALAHPHVLVDAKAEIVFDDKGEITAIRHVWQFDKAFTAFAVQGLDANNDGKLSDDELAPLAKVNVESLAEFDFFTFLTIAGKDRVFVPPTEYWLEFHNARLTLFYTLPLKTPVAVDGKATLEIFDPQYFVAFTLVKDNPVTLDGAPAGCKTSIRLPGELDPQTAAVLGAVPIDQRVLPPDLRQAASVLANVITIACPQAAAPAPAGKEVAMIAPPDSVSNALPGSAVPSPKLAPADLAADQATPVPPAPNAPAPAQTVPAPPPSDQVATAPPSETMSLSQATPAPASAPPAEDVVASAPAAQPDSAATPVEIAVAPTAGHGFNTLALVGLGLILVGASGIVVLFLRRRYAR